MNGNEAFFRAISPEHLYFAAAMFGALTVFIVSMIYTFLYVKKRNYRIKARITDQLNDWIAEQLTEDGEAELVVPAGLSAYLKRKHIRQFITDSLINIRKNVTGSITDSVISIYEQMGLKEDSVRKMKNIAWHLRAKGIYELYMMQQKWALPEIQKYTNSDNEFVRMEAQTAVIGFSGFDGLKFLDTLTYPLTEWQQIKLLEQLHTLDPGNMMRMHIWLQSGNRYVVQFALKLAEIYRYYDVYHDVLLCLEHEDYIIRRQAVKTIGAIARRSTVDKLKEIYPAEHTAVKPEILRQIGINGTADEIDFLKSALNEPDDMLKLEAGRAIVAIDGEGEEILTKASEGNAVLESITRQIKYEESL